MSLNVKHVEFLGLPGAGKSYLFNLLISNNPGKILTKKDLSPPSSSLKKYFLNYLPFFRSSVLSRYSMNYSSHIPWIKKTLKASPMEETFKRRLYGWVVDEICVFQNYIKVNSPKVLVIDEGFCHRSLSFCYLEREKITKKFLNEYLELVPLPDLVISIKCSPDGLIKRLKSRGMPFAMDNMNDKELFSAILKYQTWQLIVETFLKNKKVTILNINNDDLLSDRELLEKLDAVFDR